MLSAIKLPESSTEFFAADIVARNSYDTSTQSVHMGMEILGDFLVS